MSKLNIYILTIFMCLSLSHSMAFVMHQMGISNVGTRFDATPGRTWNGKDVSLHNGLGYTLEGGSYEDYRDLFAWNTTPTAADFTAAVRGSFAAWEADDPNPNANFVSSLSFVEDFGITASNAIGGGAEINLLAMNIGNGNIFGAAGMDRNVFTTAQLMLTSGTTNYSRDYAIGSFVHINTNRTWDLDLFQQTLTHEIGHAIGLGDVENNTAARPYYDDNFDGSSAATIEATLTNHFSHLIDPNDPANSAGLNAYTITGGSSTFDAGSGRAPLLLMETGNDRIAYLTADEFAGRQYLYPSTTLVPEPSTGLLTMLASSLLFLRRKRF